MGLQLDDLVLLVWRFSNYTDLSGRGGLIAAGRWHTKGRSILYTADEPLTAFREVVNRVSGAEFLIPRGLKLLEIKVPRTISRQEIRSTDLPAEWSGEGPKAWALCQPVGDDWLVEGRSALLKVPSSARLGSFNYLVNPAHREADFVEIVRIHDPPAATLFLA